jgi:hypothetical protein
MNSTMIFGKAVKTNTNTASTYDQKLKNSTYTPSTGITLSPKEMIK